MKHVESKLEHAALIKVKFEIGRVVLTNPDGDTYTSKSEDLIDFFHDVHLWQSITTPAGNGKSFLDVLIENYQAQIAGFYNDDKTDAERAKRNAVIEEYQDLIAIYKARYAAAPSKPHTVEEGQTQEPVGIDVEALAKEYAKNNVSKLFSPNSLTDAYYDVSYNARIEGFKAGYAAFLPQSSTEEEKELWDDVIQYFENDGYTDLKESDAKKIVSDFISTYKISKR